MYGLGLSSLLKHMDPQSETDRFEAITPQAEDCGADSILENKLDYVACLQTRTNMELEYERKRAFHTRWKRAI